MFRNSVVLMAAGFLAACSGGDPFDNSPPTAPPEAVISEPSGGSVSAPLADAEIESRAQSLIDLCVVEGASTDVCTCQIKVVGGGLPADDFVRLIDLAEIGDESSAKSMLANFMINNPDIAARMSKDMLECAR